MSEKKEVNTKRYDGFINKRTGMGTSTNDPSLHTYAQFMPEDREQIEAIYSIDRVAQKVVETVVEDGMREGYELVCKDDSQKVYVDYYEKKAQKLELEKKIFDAWTAARLYGGSAIVFGFDDGKSFNEPIDFSQCSGISFAFVADRYELTWSEIERDPTKKFYGLPKLFRYSPINGGFFGSEAEAKKGNLFHRSRMIIFDGKSMPTRISRLNQYWGRSELTPVIEAIKGFNLAHASNVHLLNDFSCGVLKIKDFDYLVSANEEQKLWNKLSETMQAKSMFKMFIHDSEDEYTKQTTSVAGISDLISACKNKLITDSGLPHHIVLGEGADGGLGAEGKLEQRAWYDRVSHTQESYLKPKIKQILKFLCGSYFGEKCFEELEKIDVKFNSLWQQDDTELAATRKAIAEIDQIYIQNGVLDPEEVRASRFAEKKYSLETTIDKERILENEEIETANEKTSEASTEPLPSGTSTPIF